MVQSALMYGGISYFFSGPGFGGGNNMQKYSDQPAEF